MMKSGARDYLVKGAEFLEVLPSVAACVLAQIEQEGKLAAAEEALRFERGTIPHRAETFSHHGLQPGPQFRYTWVHNDSVVQTGKDMLGKTDADLFPAEEADRLTQIKVRVLMTGTGLRQEVSLTAKGQKTFMI